MTHANEMYPSGYDNMIKTAAISIYVDVFKNLQCQ